MERMRISMSEDDIDLFERKRAEEGMSKASFIRLLLAEHENTVPTSIKYKEIIVLLSEINTTVKEILINEKFDTETKLLLDEKIQKLINTVKEKM